MLTSELKESTQQKIGKIATRNPIGKQAGREGYRVEATRYPHSCKDSPMRLIQGTHIKPFTHKFFQSQHRTQRSIHAATNGYNHTVKFVKGQHTQCFTLSSIQNISYGDTLLYLIDTTLVYIHADNLMPTIGQPAGNQTAEISQAYNQTFHTKQIHSVNNNTIHRVTVSADTSLRKAHKHSNEPHPANKHQQHNHHLARHTQFCGNTKTRTNGRIG